MSTADARLPRVCLLASTETSPSVLYGLFDVLSTVGAAYSEMTTGEPGEPLLDVQIVAATAEPFRCFNNVAVEPHMAIDELDEVDVAIVCDMYQPIDQPPRGRYQREVEWLRRVHGNGALLASVCSGSLILAEAGLLNGLEAAGHWAYRGLFRDHYPMVELKVGSILSLGAEDDRIVTAGSVAAWQELALYLITRLCGPQHAVATAKLHLLSDHADGQLPFAVLTPHVQQSDAAIADCQRWIAENYACTNPVARMAERADLKPRTFARRFRAATGYQPMDYVHAIRIEKAKELLESGTDGVEEVGHKVGYEDPTSFRRLFKRKTGLSPAAYRRKFAGIVAPGLQKCRFGMVN